MAREAANRCLAAMRAHTATLKERDNRLTAFCDYVVGRPADNLRRLPRTSAAHSQLTRMPMEAPSSAVYDRLFQLLIQQ